MTARLSSAELAPRIAAWTLTGLFALAVSAGVFQIPIQVSDNLDILEAVDEFPSVSAAFVAGLHSSSTMLRPLRQVQTKLLLNVAHASGDRYNMVFRGYHAAGATALILLFGALARPRTWIDVAALAFALTVLTGLHTFAGMVREAYPVNHFLLIALACLVTLALGQSRGGLAVDAIAVICFALAMLTLESGILVWVVAVAGYVAGRRGISRRGLVAMSLLFGVYLVLRIAALDMTGNTVGERSTGFGLRMLSTAEQEAEFGDRPWPLYAYTVLSSALTVPFSQPVVGQWTAVQAWLNGEFSTNKVNSHLVEVATSAAATSLIVYYVIGRRRPHGPRRYREPVPLVALAVLVASAGLSYAYAKSEIMSAAGVLYALSAYLAAGEALSAVGRRRAVGRDPRAGRDRRCVLRMECTGRRPPVQAATVRLRGAQGVGAADAAVLPIIDHARPGGPSTS